MKQVAAYCRVSTDKADQLNSLDMQIRFFEQYAAEHQLTLVEVYADEGISGTKIKKREAFLRLMADAPAGGFDTVLVKDISRFARNTVDFLQSIRRLRSLEIETLFLTANQTVLGNSEFILTVFSALAQEESANMSKRVKFGKRMNAEKGRVPNLVYGYDKIPGELFALRIDPEEAQIVQKIFDLYTEHGMGTTRIAALLSQNGARTKRGCHFGREAVLRILKNELYTGRVVNHREEVRDFLSGERRRLAESEWLIAQKPELRLIADAQFQKAQALLKERGQALREQGIRPSGAHALSTLIRCGCCGHACRRLVRRRKESTTIKWGCGARNANGADACENTALLPEETVFAALDAFLRGIPVTEEALCAHAPDKAAGQPNAQALSAKIARLPQSRARYTELYAEGLMEKAALQAALSRLDKEQRECEAALLALKAPMHLAQQESTRLRERLRREGLPSVCLADHAILRGLIARIDVQPDRRVDIFLQSFST